MSRVESNLDRASLSYRFSDDVFSSGTRDPQVVLSQRSPEIGILNRSQSSLLSSVPDDHEWRTLGIPSPSLFASQRILGTTH